MRSCRSSATLSTVTVGATRIHRAIGFSGELDHVVLAYQDQRAYRQTAPLCITRHGRNHGLMSRLLRCRHTHGVQKAAGRSYRFRPTPTSRGGRVT